MSNIEFIRVKEINDDTMGSLKEVYNSTISYFKLAGEDILNLERAILEDFENCPVADKNYKNFGLLRYDGVVIGVLDLIKNFPDNDLCYIGLFLISEGYQRKGIGTKIYLWLEESLKNEGFNGIQLGVLDNNPMAYKFWKKMGFVFRKEVKTEIKPQKEWVVKVMRKYF